MWLHQKYNLNIICKNFSFLTFCIWITMLKLYKFWNRLTPDNWTGFCLKLKCALSTKIWGCNYIIGTLYNECLKMCKLDHITSKQTIYRTLWYNLHYNQLAFWGIIAKMRRSREFMEHSIVTEYSYTVHIYYSTALSTLQNHWMTLYTCLYHQTAGMHWCALCLNWNSWKIQKKLQRSAYA